MTKYRYNGREVTREEWDAMPKHKIVPGRPPAVSGCIHKSITNFCRKDQIESERATDMAHGVPATSYKKVDGARECYAPVWEGRKHAADWQRARGLFNKDAGYGDAQPENH